MEVLKNRYILIISILVFLVVGVGIYTYASKSFGLSNNKSPNVANQGSPSTPNKLQNSQNQNVSPVPQDQQPQPVEIKEFKVKGIYLTGWSAGRTTSVDHFIKLINSTELNSVVIDVKDDDGRVSYKSSVPMCNDISSAKTNMVSDIRSVIKKFKDNNVHTIARIVTFKDPILGEKRPDLAFKTVNGGLWRDRKHAAWLDPSNPDSWNYSIDLAKEAADIGFDEIQFDYVRYPTDGNVKNIDYKNGGKPIDKTKFIDEFLAQAKKELAPLGMLVSADVFGIITTNIGDVEKIGQDLEKISKDIDYISPMVYPSHYALGQYGINKPDLVPYKIVYKSLSTAKERLDKLEGHKAKIRPYLQDFTASWIGRGNYKKYTAEDVRAQIKATYDSGLDEWILWNANNKYSESAFLPE